MTEEKQREMKKILFITGTRADFGKLKPLMLKVDKSEDFLCNIFVTGMHTLSRYGRTVIEIEKSGFHNIYQYMNQMIHTSRDMDVVLASTIQGLSHYVREYVPDLIVVHGDRVEALGGAIVGSLNNILVAHIEGGEISGTIDEIIRHAVSKMAHVHFVANDEAKKRLIQLGEKPESIWTIGSPDIDIMFSDNLPSLSEVRNYYDITAPTYGIFMYHPVTTEYGSLKEKIYIVVEALKESGWNFVVVYPNNDPGSEIILESLMPLQELPCFRLIPSLRFEYFLTLLKNARAIVGNSSAGIREAPAYCVPTVDIGERQKNRFNHHSIINVPENKEMILNALAHLPVVGEPSFHFGEGNSAGLFIKCLQECDFWNTPVQKQFQDLLNGKEHLL